MTFHSPYDEPLRIEAVGIGSLYHLEPGPLFLHDNIAYLSKRGVDLVLLKHNGDQVFHPSEAALTDHNLIAMAQDANHCPFDSIDVELAYVFPREVKPRLFAPRRNADA